MRPTITRTSAIIIASSVIPIMTGQEIAPDAVFFYKFD
jgi:hypothetical protein